MTHFCKRLLALCLCLVLVGGLFLQVIPAAKAVDYLNTLPQAHYGEYSTVNLVRDIGDCYSMQGMTVDKNYVYCAKIGSNDAIATVVRLNKTDGALTNMTNTATGTQYFYNLGHANALDITNVNGADQLFVTAGATLVRLTMSGTSLTTAGTYTASLNGATASMTAVQIMSVSATEVKVMVKSGRTIYTGTLDPQASSGDIALTKLCTLDVTNVRLKGTMIDYSAFTQQGFDYHDGKLFLPLTGNAAVETINYSVVLVYDMEGASGTVRNDPSLSFRVISGTYAGLFEIEDVAVCDTDGKLYFSTNRRKTESDTDYDACSYFDGYVYDPAMSTFAPADYRWETVDNQWVSVMEGGNTFNNPIQLYGSIANNEMDLGIYHMSRSVILKHDVPWAVEWKSSGTFGGGAMLLSRGKTSYIPNEPYLFRYKESQYIAFGYFTGSQHNNYGIKLSDHGIDGTAEHVYRLTNKIASDGSNMVYLSVDGNELGAMNNYFIGTQKQNVTDNWVSGQDFTFSYQGTFGNPINKVQLDYLQIWADGEPEDVADRFRWETSDGNFVSVSDSGYSQNTPYIYNGSISGITHSATSFRLTESVVLRHDRQWSVQWEAGANGSGTFILSAAEGSRNENAPFIFRYGNNLFFLGAYDGTQHANSGIDISDYGIDGSVSHVYTMTNKLAADGTNMVYLSVDGVELGAMNHFYSGIGDQGTTTDWLNGRDFVFDYVGNRGYVLNGDYTYLEVDESSSHNFTAWQGTNATCTTEGYQSRSCTICGETETRVLPATGHSYTAKVTAPTCTAQGYTTYTCSSCGSSYKDLYTAATGHSYVDGTCTVCGSGCAHSYSAKITTAATCTTNGVRTYTCSKCSYSYTESIAATGHSYTSVATDPTCTAQGYTTYTCSSCGNSYVGDRINATGHRYVGGSCSVCGAADPNYVDPNADYYLFGYINGGNYACEEDDENMGVYKFVNGKLTAKFTEDSYVAVKAGGNIAWYMTEGWQGNEATSVTLYNTSTLFAADKLFVPGNVEVTFTLVVNDDGSLTLSYAKAASVQPTLTLKYPTLTFEDVITMNVFFSAENLEDVVEMGLITYKSQVSEWNVSNAEAVVPGYIWNETEQLYAASTEGIPAKEMGDTYWFAVYAKLSDGTYTYTRLVSYSPTTYAYNQLSDASMSKLVVAMLNYGAAAQTYFGYRTDSLMNANLTAAQKASIETYRSDMMDSISTVTAAKSANFTKTATGFAKRYPTITFEGAFSIDYFCQPSFTPVGDITLYYWDQAAFDACTVLTTDNATGTLTLGKNGDLYGTSVEGIAAKDLDKGVYVAFVYSDGTNTYCSGILGYSIGLYCQGLASGSDAMAPFAAATAVYGYYAKQMFN